MSIKSGRFGQVFYDPTGAGGATLVEVISLNHWTLSKKTEREDVSCFGNTNRVFVPGLPTIEGELEGFWDSAETALFDAADAATPGMLKLVPNRTETGFFWTGLAYMDAEIDVDLNAPTVSGTWAAAGDWTGPVQPPV